MKESLRHRLDQMADRFEEVTALLSDPDTISDSKKFRALSVEHSDLSELVDAWGKFCQAEEDLATANEMLADPDMKELAQDEIEAAKSKIDELTETLNVAMLPKDPNDKATAFLEIRAGTGGDEAAIFSGDLFRMYQKYAQSQGWQVEVLSPMRANTVVIKKSSAVSRAWACMDDSNLKAGLIGCNVCQPLKAKGGCIRPLARWRLCLRLRLTTRLRLTLPTCGLTLIVQVGRAVSTSIPPILRCESRIFPQAWLPSANKNALSTPTKTRR